MSTKHDRWLEVFRRYVPPVWESLSLAAVWNNGGNGFVIVVV